MVSFGLALLATLALLAAAIVSGVRRRRHEHYAYVTGFFAGLGVAIWRARVMGAAGGGLHFEAAARTQFVHRIAVALTFAVVPFVVVSGVRLARAAASDEPLRRKSHRGAATAFVLGIVLSAVLGTVMTWQALAAR